MPNQHQGNGLQAFNQKKYVLAKSELLEAIKTETHDAECYYRLGLACYFTDDFTSAIHYLHKYLEHDPDFSASAYTIMGQSCARSGNLDQAKNYYKLATASDIRFAPAWLNLGLILFNHALHYIQQHLPAHIAAYKLSLYRAKVFAQQAQAFSLIKLEAIKYMMNWFELYLERLLELNDAFQHEIDNHFKSAIQHYHQAESACEFDYIPLKNSIRSRLCESFAQYGHYLYRNGLYVKAQKYYCRAIKLDPDHFIVLNQLGMCFLKLQDYTQSRYYFDQILERTKNQQEQADAWLNKACTYRLQHNWQKSAQALREAKRLAPQDPDIIREEKNLRYLLISQQAFSTSSQRTLFKSSKTEQNTSTLKFDNTLHGIRDENLHS